LATGVSIALIVYNEEKSLARALASLEAPEAPWEVLVVDNGSTDGTKRVFDTYRKTHPSLPLRWLDHRPNNLGAARAFAAREARYPILGFLDADCVAPRAWIQRSIDSLMALENNPRLLGLGSGNRPPQSIDSFNDALALLLSSYLGHLNTPQARLFDSAREVDHLPTCNIFYFRKRLLEVGNFSPAFSHVCEDLELSQRARSLGFKLVYQPGLEVLHFQKPNWSHWAKKMFRYGSGQMAVARLHPRHLVGIKALPPLAALAAIIWAIAHPLSLLLFFLFYLSITWLYSAGLCFLRRQPRLCARVFCLFIVTHFFYSTGELWGIFRQVKGGKVNQGEGEQARLPS
jgi:GT2 family glycosyltransferase